MRQDLDAARPLPDGRTFHRQFTLFMSLVGCGGAALILVYLLALLRLPAHQVEGLWWILGAVTVIASPGLNWIQRRGTRPLLDALDALREERADGAVLRAGFACAIDLPRRIFALQIVNFEVAAGVVVACMAIFYDDFSAYSSAVMLMGAASGGVLSTLAQCFMLKRWLAPFRQALAARIPDPSERDALVKPFPLGRKLGFALLAVSLVPVVFAILLAHSRATSRALALDGAIMEAMLDRAEAGLAERGPGAVGEVRDRAHELAVPADLLRVDLSTGRVVDGDPARLPPPARDALAAAASLDERRGRWGTDRELRWRIEPDRAHALVAIDTLDHGDPLAGIGVFLALLAGTAGVALAVAWMATRDVSQAVDALRDQAARVAAGELGRLEPVESEDELGQLARAFARMAGALRATVGRVAEAAGRVDATATAIRDVTHDVRSAASDQLAGLRECSGSMARVRDGSSGIEESARGLHAVAERSASATLELGATSEQLRDTSGILFSKVDEVSSSIEQMVRSVRQVGENTEALSAAAAETGSSMEEMATAMRVVDETAEEAAALSLQVMTTARSGQERVRETIQGMEAIRESTEAAERVIRGLGQRTAEMAAILDVIDEVADETNLLALNAAIISAQAGEGGRAFAVVAGEIKRLAERVLSSTAEIGGLIRAVQEESGAAVGAIERGTQAVGAGRALSDQAGRALDEINRTASESGDRIQQIARAVQEQAKAAGHVVGLMRRVHDGVDGIRHAGVEQTRGHEIVLRSSHAMRELAEQLRSTTGEQARSARSISDGAEEVREAVESIRAALRSQTDATRHAVGVLERVSERTAAHDQAAEHLAAATGSLTREAEVLRDDVDRFRL